MDVRILARIATSGPLQSLTEAQLQLDEEPLTRDPNPKQCSRLGALWEPTPARVDADVHVDHAADTDPVTREAYSREVTSFGFWFGDAQVPFPAFYAYTSPEPAGLADTPLPAGAEWAPRGTSHLAIYPLSEARATGDAKAAALAFFEAAYVAGAGLAGWDVERYRCVDGVTDPHITRGQVPGSPPE